MIACCFCNTATVTCIVNLLIKIIFSFEIYISCRNINRIWLYIRLLYDIMFLNISFTFIFMKVYLLS